MAQTVEVEASGGEPRQAGAAGRLGAALADERTPLAILVALIVAWVVIMGRLIVLRHDRFATFDFDEGIFDQFFWQLGHLEQFNTVRGVTLAGHHASFAFLLLAPFVWLGAGPNTWNILHTIAIAATAVPLFFLVKDKIGRPWVGLVVGVAWLAQPTSQWLVQEGFHPEGMALPFLVGTYLFGERWLAQSRAARTAAAATDATVVAGAAEAPDGSVGDAATGDATALASPASWTHRVASALGRWWAGDRRVLNRDERRTRIAFVACFALTITWKEDLALALAGMGLVWLIRREWRFASKVLLVAGLWFVILGVWLVPHFAGGTVYSGIYGDLGRTPSEIVLNSVTDPGALVERLDQNDAAGYTRELFQSWGFVPFLAPSTLLIGAPQWFTNIISAANFTFDPRLHYTAIPLAALAISLVEALRRGYRWRAVVGDGLLVVALVAALLCARWNGPSPWGDQYARGAWPLVEPRDLGAKREAVARVPDGAGVSADYLAVPHLTHREVIYSFPNPWTSWNYGVNPGETGDPADVEWLVLTSTTSLRPADKALLATLRDSGEFEVRFEEGNVLVMQRVAPPGPATSHLGSDHPTTG